MVGLVQDPSTVPRPDFTSDDYAETRADFISDKVTDAEAANLLERVWKSNQKIDAAKWRCAVNEAASEEAASLRRRAEAGAQKAEQDAADREALRREDKKKNPNKYIPIPVRAPPTQHLEIISPYTQRMINAGKYCEMWYFTSEGLDAAKNCKTYIDDESLVPSIDSSGNTMWMPAATKWEPGTFREDKDLTWDEFSGVVPHMLLAMQRAHWPEDRKNVLAGFWGNLMSHPLPTSIDPLAVKTLLHYQAEQHKHWHDAIPGLGGGWSLNEISDVLMCNAADDVYRTHREELDAALRAQWQYQAQVAQTRADDRHSAPRQSQQRRRSASPPSRSLGARGYAPQQASNEHYQAARKDF
ncbi:hypothetical protein M422DRAFT_226577 [Sphaerobolus stellatus SS14]|uniref:Uncharacterized protein n=1 Tax=Sphaerobolus stellatus (strain SS14) TaxID=990650 RepID=A0A0C9UV21_SPHS4|nr:hypothetical protein M422DRAFT_226577 [Sphaerobolus stellatus SS14]